MLRDGNGGESLDILGSDALDDASDLSGDLIPRGFGVPNNVEIG